ncbi:hypothetical protein PTKIN_Ptkin05aG0139100 [Pterospermum kingtungense]
MELALDLGFNNIILEGDSLSVIKGITSREEDLSLSGNIIEVAKCKRARFQKCQIAHTGRDTNEAAHVLAKRGVNSDRTEIWVEECPPCIQTIVRFDIDN